MKHNWPTREEWAKHKRTAYYDCFEDLPSSKNIADYASPEEIAAAVDALKDLWNQYGRRQQEAKDNVGPALQAHFQQEVLKGRRCNPYHLASDEQKVLGIIAMFKDRRRNVNEVIKQLRNGRIDYQFDAILKRDADPQHASPSRIDPVLTTIQSRYHAAL
jgi:hypothetical protein